MQQQTDEYLMARVKSGNLDALGELYERYKSRLITFFLRLTGDKAASNDLLMSTFERIHRYRKSYREESPFRSWCYQIANNLTKDHFKGQTHQAKHLDHAVEGSTVIEDSKDSGFSHQQLYAALNKLSDLDKRIVTQYYILELPYREIAVMENITINTARIRVCRALKQLKQDLKGE